MNQIAKKVLISLLFLTFLNLSFYGLKLIFFQKSNFWTSLILFLVALFFSLTFLSFLSLAFLRPLIYNQKEMKDSFLRFVVYFFGLLSIFLWFGINGYILLSSVFFLVFLFLGDIFIKREEKLFVKFHFKRILKTAQNTLLTGIAILIAFLAFLSPKFIGGKIELPRSFYDDIFPRLEKTYSSQIPGFSGEMTIDEFLLLQGFNQGIFKGTPLGDIKPPRTYQELQEIFNNIQLSPAKDMFQQVLQQGRSQFSKTAGIELKGDEKMKDVVYQIISYQISLSLRPYRQIGIAGLIFFFFILSRGLIGIVGLFYPPVAWLLFEIFRKIKFFRIEKETIEREKIII